MATTRQAPRFQIVESKWKQTRNGSWETWEEVTGATNDAREALTMLAQARAKTMESGIQFRDAAARSEANALDQQGQEERMGRHTRRNPPALPTREQLADNLETVVDSWGLAAVIDLLSDVCMDKHYHIVTEWQDRAAARPWKYAAEKLATLSGDGRLPS